MKATDANDFSFMLQFVGESSWHFISVPFVQSGYLYATDGRFAVRVPTDARDTEIPGINFPKTGPLFDSVERRDPSPIPLPIVRDGWVSVYSADIETRYWNRIITEFPNVRLASEVEPGRLILFVFDFNGDGDGEILVMTPMGDDDE